MRTGLGFGVHTPVQGGHKPGHGALEGMTSKRIATAGHAECQLQDQLS